MSESMAHIDKLAFIELKDQRVLVSLSQGKNVWYIPGGKREPGESDAEALIRECREELAIELDPDSLVFYGTFEAPAHGKPAGTMVTMRCYRAKYQGELTASNEIAAIDFFDYQARHKVALVDQLIMDDLFGKGLLS